MALIVRGCTQCSVCGEVLQAGDEIIGWTAFLEPGHPLWRFSDSGMHRSCFLAWPLRAEFTAAYNNLPWNAPAPNPYRVTDAGDYVRNAEFGRWIREQPAPEDVRPDAEARARAEARWAGQPRRCPQCDTNFVSVQDRGRCPQCGHIFRASDPDG